MMIEECGCPSHHEHGPEGAAGCAICNQEARSGRRQPLDGTTPVTLCTCGHHADAHDPWGCVICGGNSQCAPVALGPIEIAATELGTAPAVMTSQTVLELVEEERRGCLRALLDSALISSATPAVSHAELTSALDEIITRMAGGQAARSTEDSASRESSGPDRLPPRVQAHPGPFTRAALPDCESSGKEWICVGCGALLRADEEHTCL